MAEQGLAGGLVIESLPVNERFRAHALAPRNIGHLDRPDASATGVGVCGDSIDVDIRVENDLVAEIACRPHGCVHTLVAASAMSELALGLDLERALELDEEQVSQVLGGLPPDHVHCARLAVHALEQAIDDYYRRRAKGRKD